MTDDRDLFIFTAMHSIVQPVERVIEDAQRFHWIPKRVLRMVCSWCPDADAQMRAAHEAGEVVSHGVCGSCQARMEAE
jgi:hypothetical protein